MWLCLSVCMVLSSTLYATPVSNTQAENVRTTREIIECCPCDGARNSRQDSDADATSNSARAAAADDCPCNPRNADSEGAPSILVPNTVRSSQPFVSKGQSKEDPTHILQPEVDFASSFLNTLKEATDEEYKEALARDAARTAAREADFDKDTEPRSNEKKLVTIIVNHGQDPLNDDDDVLIPEASHVQEARCVHPLVSLKSKSETFRNMFGKDSSLGASNIQQQIADKTNYKFALPNSNRNKLANKAWSMSRHHLMSDDVPVHKEDNSNLASYLDESFVENSNKNNDNLKLHDIASRSFKNLMKFRDTELLPKSSLAEELSPIVQHFRNKLDRLNIESKLKRIYLKGILEPKSEAGSSSSNVQEQLMGLKTFFPLENMLKSKSFEESSYSDETKHTKPNIPKLKLFSPLSIKQLEIPNLIGSFKSKNIEQGKSSNMGLNDNGPSASSVSEQIASLIDNKSINEATRMQKEAAPIKPSLVPAINLSQLREVFKPMSSLSPPDIINNIAKPVETSEHDMKVKKPQFILASDKEAPTKTHILDTFPSPSEMWVDAENIENRQEDDIQTVCEVSIENIPGNQSSDLEEPTALVMHKDKSKEILNNQGLEFSENQEDNQNCNISSEENDIKSVTENFVSKSLDQAIDLNTELPQTSTPSWNDLSTDQTSIVIDQKFAPNDRLSSNNSRRVNEDISGINDCTETDTRSHDINKDIIITLEQPIESTTPDNISNDEFKTNRIQDMMIKLAHPMESTTPINFVNNEFKANSKAITYEDLQRLSDSLLNKNKKQSNKQIQNIISSKTKTSIDPVIETDDVDDEIRSYDSNINLFSANDPIDHSTETKVNSMVTNKELPLSKSSRIVITPEKTVDRSHVVSTSKAKSEQNINEMAGDASENFEVAQSFEETPLGQNKILQPKYSNTLSSLLGQNIEGSANSNTELPLLNDLNEIANLLGRGSSTEYTSTTLPTSDLISAMSKPQKSVLSPRKRLEDIYISRFKHVDLPQTHQIPLNLPKLNLNTHQSKLALPETLGIRPLNLKSVFGDEKESLGDIFNFQPNAGIKKVIAGRNNILDSSAKFPDLEDLKAKMKNNFEQLINVEKPKSIIHQGITGSSSIEALTDKFRTQTEDALQSIQNSLGSVKDNPNILGRSFTHPRDFLAELTQKHEDLKDKLEGIRYDINDRLTSFHEDFLEKSKFVIPALPKENIMSVKPKITQPKIKTATQNKNAYKHRPVKAKMASAASNAVPETIAPFRLGSLANLQPIQPNIMNKAASKIEVRKPITIKQIKPLTTTPDTLKRLQNLRASNLLPEKPKETQIKIKFPSTTNQPVGKELHKPKAVSYSDFKQKPGSNLFKAKHIGEDLKTARDSTFSPTEKNPSAFNFESPTPKEVSSSNDNIPLQSNRPWVANKQISEKNLKKAYTIPNMSWPKPSVGSDFLSKVREALKARLLRKDKSKDTDVKEATPTEDMSKAASEAVTAQTIRTNEPIKENLLYKCRMMCSKD